MQFSSSASSTSSSGSGRSSAASTNDGSVRSVTAEITPSAPSATRPAANTSGSSVAEQVTTDPSASTSSSPATWVAMPPNRAPVPCVPVEIAPEIVCASMSPRLVIASPSRSSSALSVRSVVPARTVTSPESRSAAVIPVQPPRSSATSWAAPTAVNEWPLPRARTDFPSRAARDTAPASSSRSRGTTTSVATADSLPAQFRQAVCGAATGSSQVVRCGRARRNAPDAA